MIRNNLLDYINTQKQTQLLSPEDADIAGLGPFIPPLPAPHTGGIYQRLKLRLEDPEEVTTMRVTAATPALLAVPQSLRLLEIHDYVGAVPALDDLLHLAVFSARHVPRLTTLPRSSKCLTRLVLRETPAVPSREVRKFLTENFGITHLDLSLNPQLQDADVAAGVSELKRLTSFVCDQRQSQYSHRPAVPQLGGAQETSGSSASTAIGPVTLKALGENCEFLAEISLSGSDTVDATAVSNLLLKAREISVACFCDCQKLERESESFEAAFFARNFRSPHDATLTLKVSAMSQSFVDKLKISGIRAQVTAKPVITVVPLLDPPPVVHEVKKKKK